MISVDLTDVLFGGTGLLRQKVLERYGEVLGGRIMHRFCVSTKEARNKLFRGKMTEDAYIHTLLNANALLSVNEEEFKQLFSETLRTPIPGAMEVLRRITAAPVRSDAKRDDKTTNSGIYIVADHIREEVPSIWPLLSREADDHIWSFDFLLCKDDEKFFQQAYNIFGCYGDDDMIVYIDNMSKNVAAAQKAGFEGVLYRSPEQLESSLKNLGFEFAPAATT